MTTDRKSVAFITRRPSMSQRIFGSWLPAGVLILMVVGLFSAPVNAQSARSRGMGGAFLAVSDDESATVYNPAGLSQIQGREASLQVKVNERDTFRRSSGAFTGHIYEDAPEDKFSIADFLEHNLLHEPLPRRPKYSYGISYARDVRSPELGRILGGEFLGVERKIDDLQIAFGTRFPIARRMLAREQLYGGIKLRFLNNRRYIRSLAQRTERNNQSMGIGLMYHYNDRTTGGLTVENLVERWDGEATRRTGMTLNLGGALRLTKGTLVSADAINLTNTGNAIPRQYRVGVEKKFIENDLTIRMGSWNGTLTLGFGMHLLPHVRFDYAYYGGDLIKEHYVGAHVTFD